MTCALVLPPETEAAKLQLLVAIDAFNAAREEAGGVSIDFGVKGGELDQDSRAPVNLANGGFYTISESLGKAADSVIRAIQLLEPLNPTPDATKFFGTVEGTRCPLHGSWVNLFTTAADATFSKTSKRGDARASNTVDGVRGRIWNCIDFIPPSNGSSTPLEQLRVLLAAKAVSPTRIEIAFRLVKARVNRFFGLPLFGRRLTLTFPVPGPFLTRILFAFRKNKKPPPAFFEIIYLDETLRVHKTGQGAFFVQQRPTWS
ncbi:hypothetical protein AB1Y20_004585 [Prymnesium parvum]|uniref:Plastid lipid-associated protein/fibrillin conserved domain-containing protein n=1 Tax=Prymnesium parvum TaxID=97485 RepID=A0AB34IXX3_PRYPA